MATLKRFEELEAWKAARELVKAIYDLAGSGALRRDRVLRDQICRAAISIPSNIAEGFGRESRAEFLQFLAIAKGSLAEVQAQLYLALDQQYLGAEWFQAPQEQAGTTQRLIAGLMRYLKGSTIRGQRYKAP
jgi:four helix bundle protein